MKAKQEKEDYNRKFTIEDAKLAEMYVTRPLSLYRNSPSELSSPPPEGPNSGVLVIQDEAADSRWFFGLLKAKSVKVPPFPQNKLMQFSYSTGAGEHQHSSFFYALLIPVLNQPLSSNQYYIIRSRGSRKGLAQTSSKEDDDTGCCCFGIPDTPPQLFNPKNVYQRFEISNYISCGGPSGFVTKSMAPDGVPPYFLRHKGFDARVKTLKNFEPTQALGLDAALRASLPPLSFSLPCKSSNPVVVGKWYSPFIFIREGPVENQMSYSTYYEMTLEQNWEEIFEYENTGEAGGGVDVDVSIQRQVASVAGSTVESMVVGDEVMWFAPLEVGLSWAIVERVKWEQARAGFRWGSYEERERVNRREELKAVGEWRRFGCYVLVERFVVKRMDGSLVLSWDFRHTHQIRTKWE